MATIIKRKSKYSVVYNYTDESGEKRQKWETCNTHKEALKRKAQVENELLNGTFVVPSGQTIADFMNDYVSLYGEQHWSISTYDGNLGLIGNYINPIIGNVMVQDVTPKMIDAYYQKLRKTKSVIPNGRTPKNEFVSDGVIYNVHKLLSCAFKQASRWNMISKNPFEQASIKKHKYPPRDIWTAETVRKALDECKSGKLYIAMNLAFACSMREGEILGLTWDNVHISDEDIQSDNAYVYIDKELLRCSKRAIETLSKKDVYKIFPALMPNTSTRLVLKAPKTESSIRKVWMPKTVAYMLREWKKAQDELKEFLGDEYTDFNLVIALANGRPCEGRVLLKDFNALKKKAKLPDVVFHSLRHSSTTYKLKLNKGDLKATQGDTGHAEIDMITKVYAHILDDDRKINAQKFEKEFYSNPDMRDVKPPEPEKPELDLAALIEQLQQSPELAATLAQLIQTGDSNQ